MLGPDISAKEVKMNKMISTITELMLQTHRNNNDKCYEKKHGYPSL